MYAVHRMDTVLKLLLLSGAMIAIGVGAMAGIDRAPPALQSRRESLPQPSPPANRDQRFEITEANLSQRLSERLVGQSLGTTPLGAATLKRLGVELRDGQIQVTGDAQIAAATVPIWMTARAVVVAGHAVVTVDELRAASVSLPSSARVSVQASIQAQVDADVDL